MIYSKAKIENGRIVTTDTRVIDQSTLTADCWLIQFEGLAACESCKMSGTPECGGGDTLVRMKEGRGE